MDVPLTEQTHSRNLCPQLLVHTPQLEILTLLLCDKCQVNCSWSHSNRVGGVHSKGQDIFLTGIFILIIICSYKTILIILVKIFMGFSDN